MSELKAKLFISYHILYAKLRIVKMTSETIVENQQWKDCMGR